MTDTYLHPTGNLTNSNLEFVKDLVVTLDINEKIPCSHCVLINNTHYRYLKNYGNKIQVTVPLGIIVVADDTFCSANVCVECIKEALKVIEASNG